MKVRVKFSKTGAMKFVGHLDIMRYFQKAVRRAGIDVAYSGGYSPHQIMSFAAPLGVGLTSQGEYFDMELCTPIAPEEIKEQLNQTMACGISVLQVSVLPDQAGNAMASVAAASYLIRFRESFNPPIDWVSQFNVFYNQTAIPYCKKTKKGTRELDVKSLIFDMKVTSESIYLLVNASSSGNLKPDLVMEAFFESIHVPLPEFALCISREEIYGNQGTEENPVFVPLSEMK